MKRSAPLVLFCLAIATTATSAEIKGEQTKGAVLSAHTESGQQISMLVQNIEPDPMDSDLSLYTVMARTKQSEEWTNLCKPDPSGVQKAIPLSGYWDSQGNHVDADTFTFACTNGVLAKCARWGYKPWQDIGGHSGRELHQTCTRMARADYCGNGIGHTQDGTPINLWDRFGIQERGEEDEAETAKMTFEAAWGPDGIVSISRTRWPNDLERIRQECPEKVEAAFQQGLNHETIEDAFPQALLFNESIPRE